MANDAPQTTFDGKDTVEGIVGELRRLFLSTELQPGAKLREAELAARFGVSRTPVREALAVLENEGLVIYQMNRGYTVREFSLRDLLESYEMRALLEGHACRLSAERGVPPDLEREIARTLDDADQILADGEARGDLSEEATLRWHKLNIEFHGLIVQTVSNGLYQRLARSVYRIPRIFDIVQIEADLPALRAYGIEHRRIFTAIQLRQSSRAEFLMREHIQTACDIILRNMQEAERNQTSPNPWWPH